jgi:L-amino acid N-acyltransferase YncA
MAGVKIRRAVETDLPAIAAINNHYILTSVATFREHPLPLADFAQEFATIQREGLPYLVAVEDRGGEDREEEEGLPADNNADANNTAVLAYANAHSFRGSKGAYRHTVEITLYCHPERTGAGAGSALLGALLGALRTPGDSEALYGEEARGRPRQVRQVLSVMAVDVTGRDAGMALRGFYERFGFVLVRAAARWIPAWVVWMVC